MAKQPENEQKVEKEKHFLNLKLNVEELDNIKVPDLDEKMFGVWEKGDQISDEYVELQRTTTLLARYLAACCNEGAEVKDNVSKRMILTKSILREFLIHVGINGWMLYGLLSEFSHDVYQDISGTQKTLELLKRLQVKAEQRASAKTKRYVT